MTALYQKGVKVNKGDDPEYESEPTRFFDFSKNTLRSQRIIKALKALEAWAS